MIGGNHGMQDVVTWSPQAEKKGGEVCLRQNHQQVDDLLHKLNTGTDELDGMAVNRVRQQGISILSRMLVFSVVHTSSVLAHERR
jgi:hypothetical protein